MVVGRRTIEISVIQGQDVYQGQLIEIVNRACYVKLKLTEFCVCDKNRKIA